MDRPNQATFFFSFFATRYMTLSWLCRKGKETKLSGLSGGRGRGRLAGWLSEQDETFQSFTPGSLQRPNTPSRSLVHTDDGEDDATTRAYITRKVAPIHPRDQIPITIPGGRGR